MNEAHMYTSSRLQVSGMFLCVSAWHLTYTQSTATVDPLHQHPLALGTSFLNENLLWLINMLPYLVSDRASQTPNSKIETQLNNISGTVFNLNMLVMQYSLIRNNLMYIFEAIGAPCWLTLVCQFAQVSTLFCPKDDKWMKTCLN